jgi:hypothetical protein
VTIKCGKRYRRKASGSEFVALDTGELLRVKVAKNHDVWLVGTTFGTSQVMLWLEANELEEMT